jgi:hypothetical protein
MASTVRKMIDISPGAIVSGDFARMYRGDARVDIIATGTRYVRMWVPWFQIQQFADPPGQGANSGSAWRIAFLDDEIAQANADGVRVILVSWGFPQWTNGTSGYPLDTPADYNYGVVGTGAGTPDSSTSYIGPWDRMSQTDWNNWRNFGVPPVSRSSLLFKFPVDQGTTGPWGGWIRWLIDRYRGNNPRGARIFGLEILNEANGFMLWPQQTAASGGTVADRFNQTSPNQCAVANMINSASAISQGYGNPCFLMYPATADTPNTTRRLTAYNTFTSNLMNLFQSAGNMGNGSHIWTQHNYLDIEDAIAYPRSRVARDILTQQGFGGHPELWITEGGYRFRSARLAGKTEVDQAVNTNDAFHRVYDPDGTRIGMFTNYGDYGEVNAEADCGLRAPQPSGGAQRTVYAIWAKFPSLE